MPKMYLAQWARQEGIPYSTASRWFKQGKLPPGVRARRTESGSIEVETDPPDLLADLDVEALVAKLREAGYFLPTIEQAKRLDLT